MLPAGQHRLVTLIEPQIRDVDTVDVNHDELYPTECANQRAEPAAARSADDCRGCAHRGRDRYADHDNNHLQSVGDHHAA